MNYFRRTFLELTHRSNWFHQHVNLVTSMCVCVCEIYFANFIQTWEQVAALPPFVQYHCPAWKPTHEESDVSWTMHRKWFHFHLAVRLLLNPCRISAINNSSRFSEAGDHMHGDGDVTVFLLRKRAPHARTRLFSFFPQTSTLLIDDMSMIPIKFSARTYVTGILWFCGTGVVVWFQETHRTHRTHRYCSSRNCFCYCPRWFYGWHGVCGTF